MCSWEVVCAHGEAFGHDTTGLSTEALKNKLDSIWRNGKHLVDRPIHPLLQLRAHNLKTQYLGDCTTSFTHATLATDVKDFH